MALDILVVEVDVMVPQGSPVWGTSVAELDTLVFQVTDVLDGMFPVVMASGTTAAKVDMSVVQVVLV